MSCLPTWSLRPWARRQMVAGVEATNGGSLRVPQGCAWHRVLLLAPWSLKSHLKFPFRVAAGGGLLKQLVGGWG